MIGQIIVGNVAGLGYACVHLDDCTIRRLEIAGAERQGEVFLAPDFIYIYLNGFAGMDFSNPELEPEQATSIPPALCPNACPTTPVRTP